MRRKESNCSGAMMPASAQAAYNSGAAWPFERMNRSLFGCFRVLWVVAHHVKKQSGNDVCSRHAGSWVSRARLSRRVDGMNAQPCSFVCQQPNQIIGHETLTQFVHRRRER